MNEFLFFYVLVAPQRISLVPVDLDEFMHRLMLHPVGSGMIDWFQGGCSVIKPRNSTSLMSKVRQC